MSLISDELVQKALQVKSAQELLELARENGIELSEQEAISSFEMIKISRGE